LCRESKLIAGLDRVDAGTARRRCCAARVMTHGNVRARILAAQKQNGTTAMAIDLDDLLPKKKAPEIVLGADLSAMSEHELVVRIAALETEIARCRDAIIARQSTKAAADSVFRKS
jgi:uncharacterized small protein (DUF1192 family)